MDKIIELQKEITEDLWQIRFNLYNQIKEIEKKIEKLKKIGEDEKDKDNTLS